MAPKTFINVPVDSAYFPELKELKLRYAAFKERDVTWGEFLKWLCDSVFGARDTWATTSWNIEKYNAGEKNSLLEQYFAHTNAGEQNFPGGDPQPSKKDIETGSSVGAKELGITAEMGQSGGSWTTPEELEAHGVVQNDVMGAELARMTLTSVFLSERSCQRIAEILMEKEAKGQS